MKDWGDGLARYISRCGILTSLAWQPKFNFQNPGKGKNWFHWVVLRPPHSVKSTPPPRCAYKLIKSLFIVIYHYIKSYIMKVKRQLKQKTDHLWKIQNRKKSSSLVPREKTKEIGRWGAGKPGAKSLMTSMSEEKRWGLEQICCKGQKWVILVAKKEQWVENSSC